VSAIASIRLSQAIENYLAYRGAMLSAKTLQGDRQALGRFLDHVKDRQLRNLRREHFEDYFVHLLSEHRTRDGKVRPPVSASTANFIRAKLRAFCDYLLRRGLIKADPMTVVRRLREPRRARLSPNRALLAQMLDNAPNARDRAFMAMAMHTACRAGELTPLRVGDVDLDGQQIRVWVSKSQVERYMPISSTLDRELRTWLTTYANEISKPLAKDAHLFPARISSQYATGGTRTAPSWKTDGMIRHPGEMVQGVLHAVGQVDLKGTGCHTLRRAAARAMYEHLIEQGEPNALRIVSKWMNHATTRTTEIYLGHDIEIESMRDVLQGRPFLEPASSDNVLPLRRRG
jgi:integrase